MAETYCGKTCAECAHKETLNCPGCKAGPGRSFGGDCELAKCVRNKSHETCDTCISRANCGTLRGRDDMPDQRRRRIEAEAEHKAAIARRAQILGKWLWILFWLIVPAEIAGLMTNENIGGIIPALYYPGQILSALCSLAYGGILLRLATEEDGYRTAGICSLIAGGVSVLVAVISGPGEAPAGTLLFTLPAGIVALVGEYKEFTAHSDVLADVDRELSEKWCLLWKWNIGLFVGMLGCTVLMLIIPLLGALAIIAAAIGLVVVSIMKLVYLYRTAKIFREYPVG